jgi:hypothetical protein
MQNAAPPLGLLPTHHEKRDDPEAGEAEHNTGFSPKHLSTVRESLSSRWAKWRDLFKRSEVRVHVGSTTVKSSPHHRILSRHVVSYCSSSLVTLKH